MVATKAESFAGGLSHHLDVWREALAADRARPRLDAIGRAELAFLPAALEVAETPASPAARAVAATLMAAFTVAVLWASLGHLDIVATAQGKIVPSERVKTIQPLETAIVRAINVKHVPTAHFGCHLVGRLPSGLLTHDCDAVHGDSGAPVMVWSHDTPLVTAIHVATLSAGDKVVGGAVDIADIRAAAMRLGAGEAGRTGTASRPLDAAIADRVGTRFTSMHPGGSVAPPIGGR